MAEPDYSLLFICPKCRSFGSIYLVKAKYQIIIKQRCPEHGGRKFEIPYGRKDLILSLIHNGVFRCYECGQQAPLDHKKISGNWTLVKLNCPTHGNKLPYQKIWGTIYHEITMKEGEGPKLT